MKKARAAIIGYGYVGKAVHAFLSRSFECAIRDPLLPDSALPEKVNGCDFAVVCVPTPMGGDGSVDLTHIEEVFSWLKTPLIVIKSTVPPGTTERLEKTLTESKLCFSPEYIGEGNYPVPFWEGVPHPTDMSYHAFHIFGGKPEATKLALQYWKRAAGPFAKYFMTDAITAELTKYMENAWIATKITFVNEMYDLARTFGSDYDELRELWLADGRVGRSHTLVYEDKRGFDGKCIPKDTSGIVAAARARGYEPALLASVLAVNEKFRSK